MVDLAIGGIEICTVLLAQEDLVSRTSLAQQAPVT